MTVFVLANWATEISLMAFLGSSLTLRICFKISCNSSAFTSHSDQAQSFIINRRTDSSMHKLDEIFCNRGLWNVK